MSISESNLATTNSDNSQQELKNASELISSQLIALGETLGEYKPYDSQLPIAEIEGTRIVKCLYQKSSKQASSYVRVPTKHLTEELIVERISELTPYFLGFLQNQEEEMIKADHKAGLLSVYCEGLSLDKIVEKLDAEEAGARLNKDKIEAWFDAEISDSLAAQFAKKLGFLENASEAELEKLTMIIVAYRKKFASLAGGKTFIKEEDCASMISVIMNCEAQTSLLGSRFVSKLEKMSKKQDETLLSL